MSLKNYLVKKTPLLAILALNCLFLSNSFAITIQSDRCKELSGHWEGTWYGLACGTLGVTTTIEIHNEIVRFDMKGTRERSTCPPPPFDHSIMEGICVDGKLSLNRPTGIKSDYPLKGTLVDNVIKIAGYGLSANFYKKSDL